MFPAEIPNLPGQIEAALQFLRFTEEIAAPKNYGGPPEAGRDLTRTELEVKDSALTGPSGQLHRMVPVERLILRVDTMGAARYADREFHAIVGNHEPRVKHTHCWRCAMEISHFTTKVCPKCQGLKCKCGGCRCNWPYASRSTVRGIDVVF